MHVVEDELHGVVADRLHADDLPRRACPARSCARRGCGPGPRPRGWSPADTRPADRRRCRRRRRCAGCACPWRAEAPSASARMSWISTLPRLAFDASCVDELGSKQALPVKTRACSTMRADPRLSSTTSDAGQSLIDPFGRAITYLRVSVTDRCDFRCVYCMSEDMAFLPKRDLLTLEELDRICSAFVGHGRAQAAHHRRRAPGAAGHHDPVPLPLAPSGFGRPRRADRHHQRLAARPPREGSRGLRREAHQCLARHPRPGQVPRASPAGAISPRCCTGSMPRKRAGLKVKINTVALKGVNEDEIEALLEWAHGRGMDLTLIEVMPLGEIDGAAHRPVPAALAGARPARGTLHAGGSRRPHRRPGPLCAGRRRPAAGSASSRR